MIIYPSVCKLVLFVLLLSSSIVLKAQADDSTKGSQLNMDAVYDRPFLTGEGSSVAFGGYIEMNTQHESTDGISSGFAFQMRRTTLFASSTIAPRLKFLLELEFEDGTKEINLEFAAIDVEIDRLAVLRAGIVMIPIGAFNQNHDGPKWNFVDRPLMATTVIPSTLSNVGVGIHGKTSWDNWSFGHEFYLTNGFNDQIVDNEVGRTSLAAGKVDPERFAESASGTPMFTGKFAFRNRSIGEIGVSAFTGIYNTHTVDDLDIDEARYASAVAVDFNTSLFDERLRVVGELCKVFVDVPATYSQSYGSQQFGFYTDISFSILRTRLFQWDRAELIVAIRGEFVDYNQDRFRETATDIGDESTSLTLSLAFRPVGTTVIRCNYRYLEHIDILGNPPSVTTTFQVGISSYF